ncbi:hypothetical protein GCM10009736_25030 [Actinomadura bangladeshensis]
MSPLPGDFRGNNYIPCGLVLSPWVPDARVTLRVVVRVPGSPRGGRGHGGRLDACDPVWQAYGAAIGTVAASVVL